EGGRGVLAAVRKSPARAGVPGRLPRALQWPATALVAGAGGGWRRARSPRGLCRGERYSHPALAELGRGGPGEAGEDVDRGVGHRVRRFRRLRAATRGAHCRPLDPWLASPPVPASEDQTVKKSLTKQAPTIPLELRTKTVAPLEMGAGLARITSKGPPFSA